MFIGRKSKSFKNDTLVADLQPVQYYKDKLPFLHKLIHGDSRDPEQSHKG